MKRRSLAARLLAIALVSTVAALLFAGVAIGHVLERFVMRGLDDRLDAQVAVLARAVRPDATLDPRRAIDLPEFGVAGSGWTWRVDAPGGRHWSSGQAPAPATLRDRRRAPPPPHPDDDRAPAPPGPRPAEAIGAKGQRLHARRVTVATPAGPVAIVAAGPRRVVEAPLREAMVPLLVSLALLGAGLAAATFVQLRIGLRPLRDLAGALAQVRRGALRHVPADQPAELAGLVGELNALVDQNEAGLAHARRHVANLAHGMKTPLAALALALAEGGRDPDGTLAAMVAQIDRRVRHHLGRARAAAPGGAGRTRASLAGAVGDLVGVLGRLHADRALAVTLDVADDLSVAVDAQDLDEMLGNLLDNAWRHAGGAVRVSARRRDAQVEVAVADDGPGLDDSAIVEALIPGRRLDERGDGHGFGLSIVRELAELNGGTLALARGPGGGLVATLALPA